MLEGAWGRGSVLPALVPPEELQEQRRVSALYVTIHRRWFGVMYISYI